MWPFSSWRLQAHSELSCCVSVMLTRWDGCCGADTWLPKNLRSSTMRRHVEAASLLACAGVEFADACLDRIIDVVSMNNVSSAVAWPVCMRREVLEIAEHWTADRWRLDKTPLVGVEMRCVLGPQRAAEALKL